MTQFAVHRYRGRSEDIVFLVQLQSTRLERVAGRVVIPLLRVGYRAPPDHPLTPYLTLQGVTVYADPLDIATAPVQRLGEVLQILPESDQDRIIRAVDEMLSRA
ncbi:MAG TPA: CcdB family protein [Rhodopila sp.]